LYEVVRIHDWDDEVAEGDGVTRCSMSPKILAGPATPDPAWSPG
jgi:hypothetical protein